MNTRTGPIVVAGASGRVGSLVAQHLLAEGHRVRAVARNAGRMAHLGVCGAEIHAGALDDRAFLTQVFRGARAAFVLTPVDLGARDVNAMQQRNLESTVAAIRDARVEHVVLLSSWGAELRTDSGGIIACHNFETLLDQIPGLNVVHLRPVWFMENFLWNIPLIKMAGVNGLAIAADVAFPTVATRDIAPIAAAYLARCDFSGRTVRYLNGPADVTMREVTRTLGASIGNSSLRYIEFPEAVMRKGLIESGGLSPNAADLAIAVNRGIQTGRIRAEARTQSNSTSTTIEEFARTAFAPAYKAAPRASVTDRISGLFLRSFLSVAAYARP